MPTYLLDAARTRLTFAVRGRVPTEGDFRQILGRITVDERDNPQALAVTIAARSLDTGLARRDHHLTTATFLDGSRYPTITYSGQRFERMELDRFVIYGQLCLHGREHPVQLEAVLEPDSGQDGARRALITGVVSRTAFGIPRNPLLGTLMRLLIGDEVYVTAHVVGTLAADGGSMSPSEQPEGHGFWGRSAFTSSDEAAA